MIIKISRVIFDSRSQLGVKEEEGTFHITSLSEID